eukprot:1837017-Pleurochrysis_carterae.AAC.2
MPWRYDAPATSMLVALHHACSPISMEGLINISSSHDNNRHAAYYVASFLLCLPCMQLFLPTGCTPTRDHEK